jgi:hypothetical protein
MGHGVAWAMSHGPHSETRRRSTTSILYATHTQGEGGAAATRGR